MKKARQLQKFYKQCPRPLCYNLDVFFADIISRNVSAFRKRIHTHPCELEKEEWHEILDKIVWTFEQTKQDYPIDWSRPKKEAEEYWDKIREGRQLFIDYFDHLWD